MVVAEGAMLVVTRRDGTVEHHQFATDREASERARFITEALSWIGTPFLDCAAIKGRQGGVDCAMLLTRAAIDAGIVEEFDPRPYPPRLHVHRDEQRFIATLARLGAQEVAEPRVGNIAVWCFGRSFAHGGVIISSREVMHAYGAAGCALVSDLDEPLITTARVRGENMPRPVKYFDCWAAQ